MKSVRIWAIVAVAVFAAVLACWAALRRNSESFMTCYQGGGEDVRVALVVFRQAHGRFPLHLGELPAFERHTAAYECLNSSQLSYRSDRLTYRLEFSDFLVSWISTDERPGFHSLMR